MSSENGRRFIDPQVNKNNYPFFFTSEYDTVDDTKRIDKIIEKLREGTDFKDFGQGLGELMADMGLIEENSVPADILKNKFKEQNIKMSKYKLINGWFDTNSSPNRDNLFKICFALGFGVEGTHFFLTQVAFENTFNFRDPLEVIHFFCLKHSHPYNKSLELKSRYDLAEAPQKKMSSLRFTREFESEVHELSDDETELMDYLMKHQHEFGGFRRTARENYKELKTSALEKLKRVIKTRAVRNEQYKFSYTNETLIQDMVAGIYFVGEGRPVERLNVDNLPDYLKRVTFNLPSKQSFSYYDQGKREIPRQTILLLKFYDFFIDFDKDVDSPLELFCHDANDLLFNCGMNCLCPHNRFDYVLLKACQDIYPIEAFNALLASFFGQEP